MEFYLLIVLHRDLFNIVKERGATVTERDETQKANMYCSSWFDPDLGLGFNLMVSKRNFNKVSLLVGYVRDT